MSNSLEYDVQFDTYEEGTPAQLTARRTRRRRRHGKKQGFPQDGNYPGGEARSEDIRGRWLPPSSATSLTLAQLGIHVAPERKGGSTLTLAQLGLHVPAPPGPPRNDAPSRNVVTCGDLDLLDSFFLKATISHSPGAADVRNSPSHAMQMQQLLPQYDSVVASSWQEEQRILSVPSPQVALGMADTVSQHWVPPRTHSHPLMHTAPMWNAEADAASRQWLCASQYGTQPIFQRPHVAEYGTHGSPHGAEYGTHGSPHGAEYSTHGSPHSAEYSTHSMPLSSVPPPTPMAAAPPMAAPEITTEAGAQLETLLKNLAAEAYQD